MVTTLHPNPPQNQLISFTQGRPPCPASAVCLQTPSTSTTLGRLAPLSGTRLLFFVGQAKMMALKRTWSKQGLLQHSVPGDRVRGQCAWLLAPGSSRSPSGFWCPPSLTPPATSGIGSRGLWLTWACHEELLRSFFPGSRQGGLAWPSDDRVPTSEQGCTPGLCEQGTCCSETRRLTWLTCPPPGPL